MEKTSRDRQSYTNWQLKKVQERETTESERERERERDQIEKERPDRERERERRVCRTACGYAK